MPADAGRPPDDVGSWDDVLDELHQRLGRYQRALQGAGPPPGPYAVPEMPGPLPPALAARARLILAGQQDVEYQLRARMGALAAVLHPAAGVTPAPVFVDRRS